MEYTSDDYSESSVEFFNEEKAVEESMKTKKAVAYF